MSNLTPCMFIRHPAHKSVRVAVLSAFMVRIEPMHQYRPYTRIQQKSENNKFCMSNQKNQKANQKCIKVKRSKQIYKTCTREWKWKIKRKWLWVHCSRSPPPCQLVSQRRNRYITSENWLILRLALRRHRRNRTELIRPIRLVR